MRSSRVALLLVLAGFSWSLTCLNAQEAKTTAEAPVTSAPPPKGALWFEFLDARGRPVPKVQVDFGSADERDVLDNWRTDAPALPPSGWKHRTYQSDAKGLLFVDGLEMGSYRFVARNGSLGALWWGKIRAETLELGSPWEPTTIFLRDPRRFVIRVRDPKGEPIADSLVGLSSPDTTNTSLSGIGNDGGAAFANGVTGADGRVVFWTRPSTVYRTLGDVHRLDVFVPRFGGEAFRQRFDIGTGDIDLEVTMARPVVGRLRTAPGLKRQLVFVRPGKTVWQPSSWHYHILPRLNLENFPSALTTWALTATAEGREVANFAPGGEVTVTAMVDDAVRPYLTRRLPETASRIDLVVPVAEPHDGLPPVDGVQGPVARLKFRLVESNGDPIDVRTFGSIGAERERWGWHHLAIDERSENGTMVIRVPAEASGTLVIGDPFAPTRIGLSFDENGVVTHLNYEALAANATLDLGVVTVKSPPVLVTGRVLNPAGQGVSQVSLRIIAKLYDRYGSEPEESWLFAEVDKEGKFRARGRMLLGQEIKLEVHGRGSAAPLSFKSGVRDLKVVVDLPGRLFGWVALPSREMIRAIDLELRRVGANESERIWLRGDGAIFARGLAPGRYVVEAKREGGTTLKSVAFDVRAGQDARPKELQGWALMEDWRVAEVTVLAADGRPMVGAEVACSPRSQGRFRRELEVTDETGVAEFVVHEDSRVNLMVKAPRSEWASLSRHVVRKRDVRIPVTVRFGAPPTVKFAFQDVWPEKRPTVMRFALERRVENAWSEVATGLLGDRDTVLRIKAGEPEKGTHRLVLLPASVGGAVESSPASLSLVTFEGPYDPNESIAVRADAPRAKAIAEFLREHYPAH